MRNTAAASPTGDQLLALALLLGRSGRIIESEISGTSMGSTLPAGCRIRICPLRREDYQPGQVVAFVSGDALFAHRIVSCCDQGALTRGDNRSWCDLPLPWRAILGLVTESQVDGVWRPLADYVPLKREGQGRRRTVEALLRACLQIDIRLARFISRTLMVMARWRGRFVNRTARPGTGEM
jgi:hypothetical protein